MRPSSFSRSARQGGKPSRSDERKVATPSARESRRARYEMLGRPGSKPCTTSKRPCSSASWTLISANAHRNAEARPARDRDGSADRDPDPPARRARAARWPATRSAFRLEQDGDRVAERAELLGDPGDVLVRVVRLRPRERGHEANLHLTECRSRRGRGHDQGARAGPIARRSAPPGEDPRRSSWREFGAPLGVQELDLDEPKAVLVRLVACGVCHTDLYTASVRTDGYAPTVLGQKWPASSSAWARVASLAPGDHVVTLFSPQCASASASRHERTSAWRSVRSRARATCRTAPSGSRGGEPMRHFMGTSTFAEYTVMPEIALAKVNPEAPLPGAALFACGLSTGLGAAIKTAAVEPGSTCASSGAGMVGLGAVAGCRPGCRSGSSASTSPRSDSSSPGDRARPRRWSAGRTVGQIVERTGGFGADYTFEATGNVAVMRQAVESARMGWGLCTVAGVAGKGETLDVVPRYLITGRRIAGSSFGGIKGRDEVPQLVERWLAGELDVDPFLSHT